MKKIQLVVILLLLIGGQQSKSQDGVIWTKDFSPYKLLNAVFSPDDKFIYATCTDIYYVIKYDLQGNILDTIKHVGGIRKFSEDGKHFWNYNGDKYDATTFEKLSVLFENDKKLPFWPEIDYWNFDINEQFDIGVATSWNGVPTSTQYTMTFDSNLVYFRPSNSTIISIKSHLPNNYRYLSSSLNPTKNEVAFVVASLKQGEKKYFDYVGIEIWDITNDKKIKDISLEIPKNWTDVILRYSPDGSVLGYQHDGKLTLYSTTDYSVLWESDFGGIDNFSWSNDSKYILYSFVKGTTYGIKKISFPNYKEIYFYQAGIGEPVFINLNSTNNMILTTRTKRLLYLLDNTITSITDPFFTTEYKTTLLQNQTNGNYQLQIEASQPNIVTYFISDAIGNILVPNLIQNLEQGLNSFDIETSSLPTGTYFLNIEIAGHSQTLKFMIVR